MLPLLVGRSQKVMSKASSKSLFRPIPEVFTDAKHRKVAFASLGFGGVAIIACFFLEDIGPKMNNNIEVFLENAVQAEKNRYH